MLESASCARMSPKSDGAALDNKWEGGASTGGIGRITEAELALGSGHIGAQDFGSVNKCEGGAVVGGIGRIGHIGAEILGGAVEPLPHVHALPEEASQLVRMMDKLEVVVSQSQTHSHSERHVHSEMAMSHPYHVWTHHLSRR